VKDYLEPEQFEIEAVHSGNRGLERALSGDHILVVLDVMLPGLNGFEVLRRLRGSASCVPVLLLTARGDDVDRIVGLEIGADDYLPKPFNPRELVARIHAILRRTRDKAYTSAKPEVIRVGDVELDTGTRSVRSSGAPVELTAVEFSLLEVLLRHAGRVVSREELVRAALGRAFSPYDRSVDMHVSKLRKKLGDQASPGEHIKTVRGAGYIYSFSESARRHG